jgi:hypothetical protein
MPIQKPIARLQNFFKFWGIAILMWIGAGYELYVLGPKLVRAILQYL